MGKENRKRSINKDFDVGLMSVKYLWGDISSVHGDRGKQHCDDSRIFYWTEEAICLVFERKEIYNAF